MLRDVLDEIGAGVELVAVSKGRSVEEIMHLYEQGQRVFGESRIQEFEEKQPRLPPDIEWHLIGTLQTKKVPKVIGKFSLIHSVDSVDLAQKLSAASTARGQVSNVLLQVNASGESTKHGFTLDGLKEVFQALTTLPGISLKGLMTMGPNSDDAQAIRAAFERTRDLQQQLAKSHPSFRELSMGMSADFKLAIACGATLVRIGSRLFT